MADQGGYRRPSKPASYSGVGKNSRRTDGQAVKSPNVQDSTDLTQGDRKIIEGGQRVQALGRNPEPRVEAPRPMVSPALGPSGMQEPPQHLMGPTMRPGEDVMAAAEAPPDPDDDKIFVLQMLASAPWGNEGVRQMLNDIRRERAPQPTAPAVPDVVRPEAPTLAPEPEAMEPEPTELGAEPPVEGDITEEDDFI